MIQAKAEYTGLSGVNTFVTGELYNITIDDMTVTKGKTGLATKYDTISGFLVDWDIISKKEVKTKQPKQTT